MSAWTWEVEQKFRVGDFKPLVARLEKLGVSWHDPIEQIDTYYAHPQRDFAATDEALRIRSVAANNFVTYKGPKVDATTKTRHEIEVPLGPGSQAREDFGRVLEALGFAPVAEVRKTRRAGHLSWDQQAVEIALDEVREVGTFVELEICVSESELERAQEAIRRLSGELELSGVERRSYLEMLLSQRAGS